MKTWLLILTLLLAGCAPSPTITVCDKEETGWHPMIIGKMVIMQPYQYCTASHEEPNPDYHGNDVAGVQ